MKKFKIVIIGFIIFIQLFSLCCFADIDENENSNTNNIKSNKDLDLSCESAILIEESTDFVAFEKNANEKMYPASTTKIMTAILVLENCELSDIVTISESSLSGIPTGYVTGNIFAGEKLSVEDLLYSLLLKSANDVAVVLADYVSGSVEEFSKLMNQKASEIGCKNTNFVNPNGIHNENHYSTASDMALIAKYCMKNEKFKKFVSTEKYTLPITNKYSYENRSFNNTNELIIHDSSLYYEYATGIKTGYTKEAGNCLIASATKNNVNYISVVLNSSTSIKNSRFIDTTKLFDYVFDNFKFVEFKKQNEIIKQIEVENGTKETKDLNLKLEKGFTSFVNVNFDFEKLKPKITLNENISAPIAKNDVLGSITYTINDTEYTSNLLATSDVEKKPNYALFIILIGCILLVFGILILKPKNHKRKKSKKRNRI